MSIKLQYNVENIGNIEQASISIKPLTIIAGINSSGKTFITKSLYTVLNSVYKNHFADKITLEFKLFRVDFILLERELDKPSKKDLYFQDEYHLYIQKIENFIQEIQICDFNTQELIISNNIDLVIDFKKFVDNYFEDRLKTTKFKKQLNIINRIKQRVSNFTKMLSNHIDVVVDNIALNLNIGLKKNFQITNLQSLINRNSTKKLKLELNNLGSIEIDKKGEIEFDLISNGIQEIQNVQNIVFFDSPVYIKIRKALEKNQKYGRSLFDKDEDKYLKGYPQYLDKLYDFIDKEYIEISDFDDISQEIQKIISGKMDVSKTGDINYTDMNNNSIPLSLTAMGISNIGLIDLLLRNNVINKGSFLIMDEPEVHLHPEWQVILAQFLYRIAKGGANIIIATHSLDFLKAFENILKEENEVAENIIAINKMPYSKEFSELSELEKVGIVLDDLSRPFYNLYMQDI